MLGRYFLYVIARPRIEVWIKSGRWAVNDPERAHPSIIYIKKIQSTLNLFLILITKSKLYSFDFVSK